MLRSLTTIIMGILFTALGLLAGWGLSHAGSSVDDHHEDEHEHEHEAHADDHDPDHDHDHEDEEHAELSEHTLKTLGVVIEPVRLTDHVRTIPVRARLVDRPENRRTVVTPLGGVVRAVDVESGQVVVAGAPLARLVRDPIPLANTETALGIVLPERKHLLEGLAELRAASTELEIARRETARLEKLGTGSASRMPELFASRLVELGYDRDRAQRRLENARAELHHHGLDDAEIARAAGGGGAPPLLDLWRRILSHHGAWGELEQQVLQQLPESEQSKPWPVVLLAELSLQGLVQPALRDLLAARPEAALRFREVAGLLLGGYSIENVAAIAEVGGLDPDLVIRAPRTGGTHWDLERLEARVGLHLDAGDPVGELYDPRRLWLQLEPIGDEIAHVRRAVQEHRSCRAIPVLTDAAPTLDAVHVHRLAPHGEQGTLAYAEVQNEVLLQEKARRSWSLQAGTEFLVQVPLETLKGRIVLPAEAVVRDGPDRVVYLVEEEDHDHEHEHDEDEEDHHEDDDHHDEDEEEDEDHHHLHFHPVPVHVELDGSRVVVIAADGALLEGQEVVVRGAFALHLALQQAGSDPGADHGHSHH